MATFEVIVLGVQGINNKVYGPGQKVTEAHFPEGNALKLEKEGKLKRISSKKEEAEAAKAEAAKMKAAKAEKLKGLQAEIDKATTALADAKKALDQAPEDADTTDLKKLVEDAEIALEIANDNFDNA